MSVMWKGQWNLPIWSQTKSLGDTHKVNCMWLEIYRLAVKFLWHVLKLLQVSTSPEKDISICRPTHREMEYDCSLLQFTILHPWNTAIFLKQLSLFLLMICLHFLTGLMFPFFHQLKIAKEEKIKDQTDGIFHNRYQTSVLRTPESSPSTLRTNGSVFLSIKF